MACSRQSCRLLPPYGELAPGARPASRKTAARQGCLPHSFLTTLIALSSRFHISAKSRSAEPRAKAELDSLSHTSWQAVTTQVLAYFEDSETKLSLRAFGGS